MRWKVLEFMLEQHQHENDQLAYHDGLKLKQRPIVYLSHMQKSALVCLRLHRIPEGRDL